MNEHLKLTQAGIDLIQHFEGILEKCGPDLYKPYRCPANVLTIGFGTTHHGGHTFNESSRWTRAQCDAAFVKDMETFERNVRKLVKVPLEPHAFSALVSFDYNTGGLHKSTLLKKLNKGDYEGAALEFHRWNKVNGKPMAGLTRRRASEALMFQGLLDENYDGVADPMPQAVDEPVEAI